MLSSSIAFLSPVSGMGGGGGGRVDSLILFMYASILKGTQAGSIVA